jgi:hypothetical protein
MSTKWNSLAVLTLAALFLIGMQSSAFAQGRGHGGGGGGGIGGGGGRGSSGGMGNSGMGQPAGVGVDRGLGTSSERSGGRANEGRGRASGNSNGRSDAGLERARLRRENARHADDDLSEHPRMAERLHTTADDLRSGYQSALLTNPNLKFGQYVAATRLAANLGPRFPNVTREAILAELAQGRSIGRTLQDLGVSERDAKQAQKQAEREVKEARRD